MSRSVVADDGETTSTASSRSVGHQQAPSAPHGGGVRDEHVRYEYAVGQLDADAALEDLELRPRGTQHPLEPAGDGLVRNGRQRRHEQAPAEIAGGHAVSAAELAEAMAARRSQG